MIAQQGGHVSNPHVERMEDEDVDSQKQAEEEKEEEKVSSFWFPHR